MLSVMDTAGRCVMFFQGFLCLPLWEFGLKYNASNPKL